MIGIIGGSGLYRINGVEGAQRLPIDTPFGKPSCELVRGQIKGKAIVFLPRHGEHHERLPSEINYRANIYALKKAGVRAIVSVSAVGSLREEIAPGDLVCPSQYLDFTKGIRAHTFFGDGLSVHISTAEPCCATLSRTLLSITKERNRHLHSMKTYACVEGPRLGTGAESNFLRLVGADIVGMTNVPEAFLAREAQLCYATLAIATDYDCWKEDPASHANAQAIVDLYRANLEHVEATLLRLISDYRPFDCSCRHSLDGAMVAREGDAHASSLLAFLRQ